MESVTATICFSFVLCYTKVKVVFGYFFIRLYVIQKNHLSLRPVKSFKLYYHAL